MLTKRWLLFGIAGLAAAGSVQVLAVTAFAFATGTPGVQAFEAQFRDAPTCGGANCGTGVLAGFGKVETKLVFGPAIAAPAAGCFGAKGTRTVTLAKDPASTLRLAARGAACGPRVWGTFTVTSGTGVFEKAKGSGVILGTSTKDGVESLRYSGVLTLAK